MLEFSIGVYVTIKAPIFTKFGEILSQIIAYFTCINESGEVSPLVFEAQSLSGDANTTFGGHTIKRWFIVMQANARIS